MSIQKRHGCRWFQTETTFLFHKKVAVKNVHGCTFLTSGTGGGGYPLSGAIHPYTTLDSEFDETSNSLLSRTTSIRGRFAEKEQEEGFTENWKNLPPMMQEREKDWSRSLVFAQAKSRPNIDILT